MIRVVRRTFQLWGSITCLVVGLLFIFRLNPPAHDWIIFSISHRYDPGVDIYRMLSDGSHAAKLISTSDQSPMIQAWERPGWLTIQHQVRGLERMALVHLTGRQLTLVEGHYSWITTNYYDNERRQLYVTATDVRDAYHPQMWQMKLPEGKQIRVAQPFNSTYYRTSARDSGYVFWTDDVSGGDLFRFEFGNPPRITQLTRRGNVLQTMPAVNQPDWVYFYAGDDTPPGPLSLYRMRMDGTDEQMVAEKVLVLQDTFGFWSYDRNVIYYWAGEADHPHLVRAEPDGSNATPLPITPVNGWFQGWSPDNQWLYYRMPLTNQNEYFGPMDLRRLNMQTGESQLVLANVTLLHFYWTDDPTWLLVLVEGSNGERWLYRMRPDGSDSIVLSLDVRGYPTQLPSTPRLVFESWNRRDLNLRVLDLETFEITSIYDNLPTFHARRLLTALPTPDEDWQPIGLMGVGVGALMSGMIPRHWNRRLQYPIRRGEA